MNNNLPLTKRSPARQLSAEDVGILFKQALDKSNPKLQEVAIKLLALFPHRSLGLIQKVKHKLNSG